MQTQAMPLETNHDTEAAEREAIRAAMSGNRREKLLAGLRAMVRLMRDPNDTKQVFVLGITVNGARFAEFARRFREHPDGERLLRERPSIDTKHQDFDALRALPEDTLGGAYVRHLDRNGLDADFFQAPPGLPPELAYMAKRTRQTHDLWHVLTGYGTDVPGEIALQAFTFGQVGMPSAGLIAVIGTLRWARKYPHLWRGEVRRGYERGKRAKYLVPIYWEEHLARPLADVRAELGIEA